MKEPLSWLLVGLTLTGCAVGPDYKEPAWPVTSVGTKLVSVSQRDAFEAPMPWWTAFEETQLHQLVAHALGASPTLEAAAARVRQARASAQSTSAADLPSLTGKGSSRESTVEGVSSRSATSALDIGLELDLFGGNLRTRQAATARLQAAQLTHRQAQLTLAAEVSSTYFGLAQCLAAVQLHKQDLDSRERTLVAVGAKVAAGVSAPAEQSRASASVAEAHGLWLGQQTACKRTHNQLATLVGVTPATLTGMLVKVPRLAPLSPAEWTAVPASAVAQRPDVASAERMLAAASADIGVAMAQLYPSLSLAGSIGVNVSNGASTQTGSWGPSVTLPLFDGGRRRAAVESARARLDELQANWRQAVLGAVQDVEDALTRGSQAQRRAQSASRAQSDYQAYFAATQARFTQGAANLLELEEARRLALNSQQTALGLHLEQLQARIALHKAAGGSWPVIDTTAAQAAAAEVYP